MPQVLISKLKEIGMSMLMPRMFALMAVQRHTAASRSSSPSSTEQQGVSGGFPTTVPTDPLSNLAQTPSLRASLGQLPFAGDGFGLGFGLGWTQVLHPLTRAKNIRLMERKRDVDKNLFDSIDLTLTKLNQLSCGWYSRNMRVYIEQRNDKTKNWL